MLPTNSKEHSGSVALVGAGPGDPELITRKGWRLILQADVLIYDALVSDELLADIPVSIARIYVGKRKGQHSMSQEAICELLIKQARLGKRVVRLKGGDPLVFGRVTEEIQALQQAGIAFTLVPGITAAAGCAASCNFSLTERTIAASVRFVTAHTCDDRETPGPIWHAVMKLWCFTWACPKHRTSVWSYNAMACHLTGRYCWWSEAHNAISAACVPTLPTWLIVSSSIAWNRPH